MRVKLKLPTPSGILALDRASARRYDQDGHLHVEMTNISKANVCPYYGREIPDWQALGLDANRVYMLYRDPVELAKAAASFAGKPLLFVHEPVTADEPATNLVVGSIGTDVNFDGVYLRAPLSVWRRDAITAIESETKRELSPGYRYTADMTRGRTPEGLTYDGVMRNIKGNHLAIVKEGRTGPDVTVADELPKDRTMRFAKFFAALATAFPTLKPEQVVALDTALDEEMDWSAEDEAGAMDAFCKSSGKAMDSLTEAEKGVARDAAKNQRRSQVGTGDPVPGMDAAAVKLATDTAVAAALVTARTGYVTQAAMDAAVTEAANRAQQSAAASGKDDVAQVHALYAARAAVAPKVGVVALDTAEKVYRFALDTIKVDHKDVPASALAALFVAGAKAPATPALDAAPKVASITELFPGLSLTRRG